MLLDFIEHNEYMVLLKFQTFNAVCNPILSKPKPKPKEEPPKEEKKEEKAAQEGDKKEGEAATEGEQGKGDGEAPKTEEQSQPDSKIDMELD